MARAGTLRRRTLLRGAALGAGSVVLLARHGRAAADKPQYGGTLRVANMSTPGALDPILGRAGTEAYFWRQFCDQLVDADPSLNPRAETSLAASWDVSDPRMATFNLRKNVVFHDGTAFNAEAVKFNIERLLDPATKATPRAAFGPVERVEVVDEHVVRFHLKRPWGSMLGMLADRGGAMNSPAAVKASGEDYALKPVSTGPFKMAEYVGGSRVRLVRNDKYWGRDADGNPLPYLDEIIINIIPSETVQVSALKAGELDIAYLPYREIENFADNSAYTVQKFDGGSVACLLSYNWAKPPMDNVNLRLAVAYAINPETINKAVFFGRAIVAKGGMWPPGAWAFDPSVPRPTYNPAKAKELLAAGGMPNGFEMDAICWPSEANTAFTQIIRAQCAAVGIKLNLQNSDVSVATEKFYGGGGAPLFISSWSRYPEPDWVAALIYRSDGYYNAGKVKNPQLDALVDEGAATLDVAKRKQIYRQVDEIVLGQALMVPMIYGVYHAAAHKRVGNIDTMFGWDAKMYLHRIWLKKA